MEKAENEQIAGEKLELQYLEHDRLLAIQMQRKEEQRARQRLEARAVIQPRAAARNNDSQIVEQ